MWYRRRRAWCHICSLEDDAISSDTEFLQDLDECVLEGEVVGTFKCDSCAKVCKSSSGLTRHVNAKHRYILGMDVDMNSSSCDKFGLHTYINFQKCTE